MKRTQSEDINVNELDYKILQKKCKEFKLKAVGDKVSLQNRLIDYFKSKDESSLLSNDEIDIISDSIEDMTIEDEIKIEKIDPKTILYTNDEIKPILQLGILVSNSLKNKKTTKQEISINTIINTFEKESENVPEYKIKTRRKVILINAIITLFEDEIKNKNQKDSFNILDDLINGGKETVKTYINSTKNKK